jgi:hypothetical protein
MQVSLPYNPPCRSKEAAQYLLVVSSDVPANIRCDLLMTAEHSIFQSQLRHLYGTAGRIGGIRMGFDNAFGKDIETVYVCEWDKFAQQTYRDNFDDPFDIAGDITTVDEKEIPSDGNSFTFGIKPFEVKTFRVKA